MTDTQVKDRLKGHPYSLEKYAGIQTAIRRFEHSTSTHETDELARLVDQGEKLLKYNIATELMFNCITDPLASKLVSNRFFKGMTNQQSADFAGISLSGAKRLVKEAIVEMVNYANAHNIAFGET